MNAREKALEKVVSVMDAELGRSHNNISISLMSGLGGAVIFYYNYAKRPGKEAYSEKANHFTNEIIDRLNAEGAISLIRPHAYSTGLAGIGFTFWNLYQNKFIELDFEESWSFLDDYLLASALKDYKEGVSDFLHGPIGILYYFIKQYPQRPVGPYIDQMLELLLHYCVQDEKGLRIRNMILEDVKNEEYDLGLAHGLAGILLVLNECIRVNYQPAKIRPIMEAIIRYILMTERPQDQTNQNSLFPTSVDETHPSDHPVNFYNYKSRLAWCYGDLSIAWALLKAGQGLGNEQLIADGIRIARATVNRRQYAYHQVGDVFFCHGSAGVSHFYKRFYQETGIQEFKEAYQYWMDQTVEDILNNSPLWAEGKRSVSVLEGLIGLGLALLPEEENAGWNEIFLLQ